ncbi:MAG: efflux RND transporter periplasmic adaptor subunit [Deltaproteobacteria bacterium]|nr:efflux RND transporter periplasmic adaptor subunit [Deltaproteobacteria bacterium]
MALEAQRPPEANLHSLRIDPTVRQPHGRHWLWSVLLILILAAVIGGGSLWLYPRTIGRPTEVKVAYAQIVGTGAAATGPVLSGAGYVVTGDRYVSIGVRVPGRIDAYEVQEGDFVRKGAVLVRLDNRDYRASLRRAQANLELAQANVALKQKQAQRMQTLHTRDLIATQELDVADNELAVARAQIHQAEAQMESARVDLDYTTLTAPTDGIVLAKLKEVGEIAVPGGFSGAGDLIRIANLKDLRAEVDINEVDFRRVRLQQHSEVVPDAYPDRKYPAQVVKVYPQANRQKGTIKVEVKLANVDEYLRPDMSVRINFLAEPVKENGATPRITVPKSTVRGTGDTTFVWLVRNERAAKVPVRIGEDFGETVRVLNGLEGGEAVIVEGSDTVAEGLRVRTKTLE